MFKELIAKMLFLFWSSSCLGSIDGFAMPKMAIAGPKLAASIRQLIILVLKFPKENVTASLLETKGLRTLNISIAEAQNKVTMRKEIIMKKTGLLDLPVGQNVSMEIWRQ